jgi:superfamily II DNA/RNA helicase
MTSFYDLGVNPALVKPLNNAGIRDPFPIQVATLPDAIAGRDVLGRGQTGSGKTLAFGLALLTRLAGRSAKARHPLALILSPTRELAMQINDAIMPLAQAVQLDSRLIAGGMPYGNQRQALQRGVPILVATPGRLKDLMEQGEVHLSEIEIVVLDEADLMADMGFLPVVKEFLAKIKPEAQKLLFSATLDKDVDFLVRKYLRNPVTHSTHEATGSVSSMEHHVFVLQPSDKDQVTASIAAREGRTIFFVRTQHGADRLADRLALKGIPVGALHGGKTQAVRTRTLAAFKSGATKVLVATDVAARGIHVDDVSLVVHVDAPTDPKDYLHRAGRTARAGESGVVATLTTTNQKGIVRDLIGRAGVRPNFVNIRPKGKELIEITGAQEPSGVPWVAPVARNLGSSNVGGPNRRKGRPRPQERRKRPR